MHKQPLFILCICFILGIIIQEYLSLRPATAYILLLTAIVPLLSYASLSLFWIGLRKYFLGFFFAVLGLLMHAEYSKNAELPEISRKQEVIFKLNKKLNSNADTVFLTAGAENMYLSSSTVKELGAYDVDLSDFLPEPIIPVFRQRIAELTQGGDRK